MQDVNDDIRHTHALDSELKLDNVDEHNRLGNVSRCLRYRMYTTTRVMLWGPHITSGQVTILYVRQLVSQGLLFAHQLVTVPYVLSRLHTGSV